MRKHVERCRDIHCAAGHFLHYRFTEIGLNCPKPQGAFYLFPDFENFKEKLSSHGITTSEKLSRRLLEETGVALLPGSDFYMPNDFLVVRVASVDYDGEHLLKNFPVENQYNLEMLPNLFPKLADAAERIEKWLS